MRLAIIGADQESLELVRWAVREGGHELVSAFDAGHHGSELRSIAPGVRLGENWESLLLGSGVEVVVIGRGSAGSSNQTGIPDDERRADQLRKLAQAAVPMLVFVPACEAIVGYEIEMIRCDANGVIVPYAPGACHPNVRGLEDLASRDEGSSIGAIEQIVVERETPARGRGDVLVQFARDVGLLRRVIGTIRSINATGPALPIGRDPLGPKSRELLSLASLSVHLAGEEGLVARWSIGPALDEDRGRFTLVGTRGRAVLTMRTEGPWSWELVGTQRESIARLPGDDLAALFADLSHAAANGRYDQSAWLAACRDQEVAEAVDRSLARGRTIELFNEQHTEEQSFKGVMAMGGCLLLMMALAVVGLATIVEGLQLPLRDWPAWHWWPVALLVPVVVFLLLQLLQLAVKREPAA